MSSLPDSFRPALIIVDLQEDFCPPSGSLPIPHAREIIAPINELLTLSFVLKLATKDWHPLSHISFARNHSDSATTTLIVHPTDTTRSYESALWPVHCVQETPGAELLPELRQEYFHGVVLKGTDERVEMYSAFFDPLGVCTSDLEERLREAKVTDVFIAGLAADYCVKATAEDAVRLGFTAWVVEEGVRAAGGEEGKKWAVEEMRKAGVGVVGLKGKEVGRVRTLQNYDGEWTVG